MRKAVALGLIVGMLVFVAAALAVPVNTKPPTISGKPAFGSVLTCNHGTWSADAITFDYSWSGDGGFPTYATTQKWRVNSGVGYNVHCHVVAHDAQGGTTAADSSAVQIANGISTVRLVKVTQKHGKLSFTGAAGPAAALKHKSFDRPTAVVYRKLAHSLLQITFGAPKFGRSGQFTLTGRDTPGKHTYLVEFIPAASSQYTASHAGKAITVRK